MSWPACSVLPECGTRWPVSWLINVVLPAPFGPMMACSSPRVTSSETWSVAMMPPKRRTRLCTRSKGSATVQPPEQSHDATASEQHDQEQKRPYDQRPVFRHLRQQLLEHEIDHG